MNINKAIVVGRVGQNPELRKMTTGTSVTSFSVATTRKWKDKNGNQQEDTQWHNIVLYGRMAEVAAEYLSKGQLCSVVGRMQTDKYEKKDGSTGYAFKIIAEEFQLGPKPYGQEQASAAPAQQDENVFSVDDMGDAEPEEGPTKVEYADDDSISPDDIPF